MTTEAPMTNREMYDAIQQKTQESQLGSPKAVHDLLVKGRDQIAAALPRHITADKMIRVAVTAVSKSPQLLQCTKPSLVSSIVEASQLGLLVDGMTGEAYLVPFWNGRDRQMQCQLIPGYKGLIKLAIQSGFVTAIEANVVHHGDVFEYEFGLDKKLKHVPRNCTERGVVTHAYAIATMKDGEKVFSVLTRDDIERSRNSSQTGRKNQGPWKDHYGPMAKKSAVRQLVKMLPLSPDIERLQELAAREEKFDFSDDDMPLLRSPAQDQFYDANGRRVLTDDERTEVIDEFAMSIAEADSLKELRRIRGSGVDRGLAEGWLDPGLANKFRSQCDERAKALALLEPSPEAEAQQVAESPPPAAKKSGGKKSQKTLTDDAPVEPAKSPSEAYLQQIAAAKSGADLDAIWDAVAADDAVDSESKNNIASAINDRHNEIVASAS